MSSSQVRAVMANVSDATEAMFAEQEESVVPVLEPLSVAHTAVALRHWRLDAEAPELLAIALRQAASPDVEGEPARTPAQRRADARVDILRRFVERDQQTGPHSRHRPHVNVVVDLDDFMDEATPTRTARIVGGPHLDATPSTPAALPTTTSSTPRRLGAHGDGTGGLDGRPSCCPTPPWRSPPPLARC